MWKQKVKKQKSRKKSMGKTFWCAFAAGLVLVLCGCGDTKGNENIKEGMRAVEAMDYRSAMDYFETAKESGEDKRLIARGMGIASMGLTEYEEAVSYFEECLSYSSGIVEDMDFDVNYYLAAAHCKNGSFAEAEQIYNAILAMREETEVYFLRGNARIEQENTRGAVEDFEKVMEQNPGNYDIWIEIYEILAAHGLSEQGQEYLQRALDGADKKMTAYDRGRIYYYLGDYLQACAYLEEAKRMDTADVYYYLGMSYEATGDYSYALNNVYIKYLSLKEGDARIYNQQGLCYLKQGDYAPALEAFQNALKIPNNGMRQTLRFNEVVAYEFLGDFETAKVLLAEYLETYPDDEAALREYGFLSTR